MGTTDAAEGRPTMTGVDGYTYEADGPGAAGHLLLDRLLDEALTSRVAGQGLRDLAAGRNIVEAGPAARLAAVHAALERHTWLLAGCRRGAASGEVSDAQSTCRSTCAALLDSLCQRKLPYTADDVRRLVTAIVARLDAEGTGTIIETGLPSGLLPALLKEIEHDPAILQEPAARAALERLRSHLYEVRFWAGYTKTVARIDAILGAARPGVPEAGEAWADKLASDVAAMEPGPRAAWLALLEHAPVPNQSKPSKKWLAEARTRLAAVGEEAFIRCAAEWLSMVGRRAQERISDRSADILKGLVWYCSLVESTPVCHAVASAAEACFARVSAAGLLCSRAGKACLWTLGAMGGTEPLAQMARLKLRVRSPWALEEIGKALTSAAESAGLTEEEVSELAVPTYSLDRTGRLRREIDGYTVEVAFTGAGRAEWSWVDPSGKRRKAAGAAFALQHAQAIGDLKREATEVEKMLAAQREHLERMFRGQRSWPVHVWRERFIDHPLVLNLARRLIWVLGDEAGAAEAIWLDGRFAGPDADPLDPLPGTAQVRPWHPIGCPPPMVLRWREALEEYGVTQPFKQAHREVYLLTEAEEATGVYSNRFAGHILKQHQFHALCRQRGWTHGYLGRWDSDEGFRASLDLPAWGLRAELWVEAAGGGDDVSDAGVLLYVSTDQVRFCEPDGTPRPLAQVPPLAFSEVMRDVDLFVGVASVGNDPAWQPAEARSADYWRRYAFGDLSISAETRRDILGRLLPRTSLNGRCHLAGRFLVVQGDLRTYKIHLGSANVLMEPNDQYLCVVADRSAARRAGADAVFLPFEGDDTLALVLSKAFMLANDASIADPTIARQIRTQAEGGGHHEATRRPAGP